MKIFKYFKYIRDRVMKHNISLAIGSVALAIVTWFTISITQYPSIQKTIAHIPLSTDISGTSAASNDLSVISCDVSEVTVELLGSRTQVGNLNNENLIAYIDADNVSNTGKKSLGIKIRSKDDIAYEIQSIEPDTASVVFDRYETREFPIKPKVLNITAVEGKDTVDEEYSCTPDTIKITGPSARLDEISYCYAVSDKTLSLDSSYTVKNDRIQLLTEDGVEIDQSPFEFSNTSFGIDIPVRTQKTVKLTVSLVNTPSDFNSDSIKFNMSSEEIVLATNNSETEIPDTLDIGKIPLENLNINYTTTFSLSNILEGTDYINVSNLETVTVSLDSEGLAETELILDKNRFTISNIPDSSYEYSLITSQLSVRVIGPEDIIPDITAGDIIADVNLLNSNIVADQFSNSVTFSCPKYDDIWVYSDSKVNVMRRKPEPPTTTATENTTKDKDEDDDK